MFEFDGELYYVLSNSNSNQLYLSYNIGMSLLRFKRTYELNNTTKNVVPNINCL